MSNDIKEGGSGMEEQIREDLARSGLVPKDIRARPLTSAERTTTGARAGVEGYVIPYFDPLGKALPFYRVRLLNGGVKYMQPKSSGNHVYFPPGLRGLLEGTEFLLVTEGEKKAAAAVKAGLPCVAFGGIESWRNKTLLLPAEVQIDPSYDGKSLRARLPSGVDQIDDDGPLAVGFQWLVSFCVKYKLHLIIVYDTDTKEGVKLEVQRASARLGYELRHQGLATQQIRQLVLPYDKAVLDATGGDKVGLDDYILVRGGRALRAQVNRVMEMRIAFPRHPDPRGYVNKLLQRGRMSRKESADVSMSILMELEAKGRRLRNADTQQLFYFDEGEHTLMEVLLAQHHGAPLHETNFGGYLYREFNISATDTKVLGWLASQYTGEPGMQAVRTHKVLAHPADMPNCIAFQISKSRFVIVTPDPEDPLLMCENGSHGILFEQGRVADLDKGFLEREFHNQLSRPPDMHWRSVLKTLNVKDSNILGRKSEVPPEMVQNIMALLFYISPWLLRWRGTQLPVELVIGEAGSGKSSLYSLRQRIISGDTALANLTNDIRDWYAGITARGGIHILDNVHFTGSQKDFRQRLSDEMCRLVTDPDPHVEMRKLYTTSDVLSLPVGVTFAITSIDQQFFQTDLIQRAAVLELEAISRNHDSQWVPRQMQRLGGRIGWVAHHLVVLHRFLKMAIHDKQWNPRYAASHRLANYEQALRMMASTFGMDGDWIPGVLATTVSENLSETDWAMQGLSEYVNELRQRHPDPKDYTRVRVDCKSIAEWASGHETFYANAQLSNPWRLGRYMQAHRQAIERTVGLYESKSVNNRKTYQIRKEN